MQPDAELLSGYLDGELTPDEQAAVEQWLAEDASARELLEELRGLRAEVQQIPRLQLPEQFAHEVLRSAERLMLLGPAELTPSAQSEIEVARNELAPPTARRPLWSSPAWFITGAAVAVLFMIAVGSWRGGGNPPVAVQPNPPLNGGATGADSATDQVATNDRIENDATANTDAAPPSDGTAATSTTDDARPTVADVTVEPVEPGDAGHPSATESTTKVSDAGAEERKRDPYGVVISSVVDRSAITEGAFDQLLTRCGVAIAPPRDALDDKSAITEDVVYVEATMEQISDVLGEMLLNPTVYKSTVFHMTLGLFRKPELWSELLDAEGAPAGGGASPGSRAVHFQPRADQAEALVIEEATQADLLEPGGNGLPRRRSDGDPDAPAVPVVDNGLVRVVFVLRVAP